MRLLSLIASALYCLPSASSSSASKRAGPPAHYVIRSSDLRATLEFLTRVTHLKVLRHEENPEPCEITCNGDYPVPWSKTMVGSAPEDEAYALEVTYNYGIQGYERGTHLVGLSIYVDDVDDAAATAAALGYAVTAPSGAGEGRTVAGPDGYRYVLVRRPGPRRREPFRAVHLAVPDPGATADWYSATLGAVQAPADDERGAGRIVGFHPAAFGWEGEGVVLQFSAAVGPGAVTQFDGRNAFSLPAEQVRSIYGALKETQPERIVYDLQELDEGDVGLGVLLILIVTDPNGLELCLVSSEAFEPAIREAADFVGPNYETRERLALEYAETVARAKKQTPDTFGWASEL